MDHIFTINQLLEHSREYKFTLCIVFNNYKKALDSIALNAVLKVLAEQGIDTNYIKLLKEANSDCTKK
ncbi:hypothetical protein KIL84_016863, partial [Mauremys mutica]